ncbi:hypothetical protein [Tepidimonas sp.]|uniref:hypothetical protein n=1 Tax=Tepidimonas sp. TaxID=2002775 RepID=UPI00391B03A9
MTTPVKVINRGLGKLSASTISAIEPPRTGVERFMADNYPGWRDSEIAKRRWRFALQRVKLTPTGDALTDDLKPYAFQLPPDCLRVIRKRGDRWEQRGTKLFHTETELTIDYLRRVPEVEFDPMFAEVLACRIAVESCEFVTQSTAKLADKRGEYKDAVGEAVRTNSFVTGPENLSEDDNEFSWVYERY